MLVLAMTPKRALIELITITMSLILNTWPDKVFAHSEGGHRLTTTEVAAAIEISKEVFRELRGTWLLNRLTRVETKLSEDGDEVEVRLYYNWGAEKLARYFCGYDAIERLSCDAVFSGPGAL